ncbi:hypothetical protein LshimejAT787_0601310 [Lyophyllum shimeji]|uniref:Uncharacterized protein n=1 Tax=Lyophyllum shimeji TaxID=47721 RepID=A0A9P3PP45_LYOSH|nr:hypothetical protein LshimejAT787_0601310 [Lyophyllum shimeji]
MCYSAILEYPRCPDISDLASRLVTDALHARALLTRDRCLQCRETTPSKHAGNTWINSLQLGCLQCYRPSENSKFCALQIAMDTALSDRLRSEDPLCHIPEISVLAPYNAWCTIIRGFVYRVA